MDFINDDKAYKIGVGQVIRFSCNDIPLFRRSDDDLGLGDLLLSELAITRQLSNPDTVWLKSVTQVADLFLDKSLERSNTDDLESIKINIASLRVTMLSNLSKNREHTNVGLSTTSGSTNKHVSVVVKCRRITL